MIDMRKILHVTRFAAVLAAAILWIGIYPAPILKRMESSAGNFVQQVQTGAASSNASRAPRLGMRRAR